MEGNFTEESRSLLISAKEEMYKLKHSYVGTEHLLLAILKSNLKNRLNKLHWTVEKAFNTPAESYHWDRNRKEKN